MPQDTVLTKAAPGVLANDSDPEGHALTMIKDSDPANGTLSINPDGSFSYTPNIGFTGTDTFTYKASDSDLESAVATVTITVNAVNQPPVAKDDFYTTSQDVTLVIKGPGILLNDSDPEGHSLVFTITSLPAHGTLTMAQDGGFSYTPDSGYSGIDGFSYTVNDGQLDSVIGATAQITVNFVNKPPVANNDSYSMPQDTVLRIAAPGVLTNDSDPEGHALTMIKDSDPANGILAINPDGSFSYLPKIGFTGTDTFTYKVSDSDLESAVATVTITVNAVNKPPVANNDSYSMPQDTVLRIAAPGVLANDSDPEGHALTMIKDSDPANGILAINPDGSFSYLPKIGFTGTDTFTYKASDSDLESAVATVTITVNAVNQPPVAVNDAYSTPQDTVLTIAAPGILVNDSDPEGHALSINVLTQPANGHLNVAIDGGISYTPDAGFTGVDAFTYTVNDGQADSNTATVQITVNAVNQPPVANNDSYSTPQDTVLNIAAPGVLANDSDPEGHALTMIKDSDPANGTLSIHPDGSFSYTPNIGFTGTDTFTYKASDSDLESAVATVTITVNAVNQPPVANNDSYSTPQDTVLNITAPGILVNDNDPESHSLSISVLTQPANGHLSVGLDGSFSYTPDVAYSGTDAFTYSVNDGALDSNTATVQITVSAVNQPPVANDDSYSTPQDTVLDIAAPGILANDTDPEGHALSISVLTQPANGHLSVGLDGSFSYTPDTAFSGTDAFTYRVNDGALDSNMATVQITVNAVNQPPVANDDSYSTPQDTALNVAAPGVLANDSDPEGHALTMIKDSDPANGTLSINPDGSFSYTPNAGYTGTDSFTYKASDSDLESAIATVTITINLVNLPPVAVDDAYSVVQDTDLNVIAPGVLGNDSDPEGHNLNLTVLTQPANGHLAVALDGGFSYTPDTGFLGTDTFTYKVSDGEADSNTAVVSIEVVTASSLTTRFATSIDFHDGNTEFVTATLSCNGGLPPTQSLDIAEGSPVEFTMTNLPFTTPGTECEITVSGLNGDYTLTPSSCVYEADAGTFASDGNNVCEFETGYFSGTQGATYWVEKFWVIGDKGDMDANYVVDVTITCDTDILAIDGIEYTFGNEAMVSLYDGDSALLNVDTPNGTTYCSAAEEFTINGVEPKESTGCNNAAMGPGESARCTFTNTIFFKGIPSLSEYGMAIMALLMLCIGFFTLRRYA